MKVTKVPKIQKKSPLKKMKAAETKKKLIKKEILAASNETKSKTPVGVQMVKKAIKKKPGETKKNLVKRGIQKESKKNNSKMANGSPKPKKIATKAKK